MQFLMRFVHRSGFLFCKKPWKFHLSLQKFLKRVSLPTYVRLVWFDSSCIHKNGQGAYQIVQGTSKCRYHICGLDRGKWKSCCLRFIYLRVLHVNYTTITQCTHISGATFFAILNVMIHCWSQAHSRSVLMKQLCNTKVKLMTIHSQHQSDFEWSNQC
jgi:hypothetical protein